MIASVKGTLLEKRPEQAVVEAAGVGYRLFISLATFYKLPDLGGQLRLLARTVVREDAMHLYGFWEPAERDAFDRLLSVSGVGPKLALAVLSGITPEELWAAVRAGDSASLVKVPGIGKKTAARMVVDLEGRMPEPGETAGQAPAESGGVKADAVSALMNLGYNEAAAGKAVAKAQAALPAGAGLEEVLKKALGSVA